MSVGREGLARFMKKFNCLHATTELPNMISDKVGVEWLLSVGQGYEDAVALEDGKLVVRACRKGMRLSVPECCLPS